MPEVLKLIEAMKIDFYGGWSVMDLFNLGIILLALAGILNYFFDAAKRG